MSMFCMGENLYLLILNYALSSNYWNRFVRSYLHNKWFIIMNNIKIDMCLKNIVQPFRIKTIKLFSASCVPRAMINCVQFYIVKVHQERTLFWRTTFYTLWWSLCIMGNIFYREEIVVQYCRKHNWSGRAM